MMCTILMRRMQKPHDILLCIQTGKKLADEDRMRYEGGQYYIKSEDEMKAAVSLCAAGVWKIRRRLQTGVRWKSNLA